MEHPTDGRNAGDRATEQILRDAFVFHEMHASSLEYAPAAKPVRKRQQWVWPALAAAVVAAVVGGVIFSVQANRPGPPNTASAPAGPYSVATEQLASSSCSDQPMAPAVVIPGGEMSGSRLEAGMAGQQLCVGALGEMPRGWVTLTRRSGAVPYFTTVGFAADSTPAGSAANADWFALGAVDASVDTIRFVPQAGGEARTIAQVAALGSLRVFSYLYDSAGTLEFVSSGSIVASEVLPEPAAQATVSTSASAPSGRPCATPAGWEASVDVVVRGGLAGDRATAAHDTTTNEGQDLICIRLATKGRSVDLSAVPTAGASVYQLFTTYQLGDSRFMVARFTAVVTNLSVRVGGADLTFGPDDLRPDALGFTTVVARIPSAGDLSVRATDSTGHVITGDLPDTRLETVDGP